ncbi:MAG TPA: hypothetical protein VHD36_17425 [Pirellulales bacterium]|nr:hypothetical protein [Pirellulales bacterium]
MPSSTMALLGTAMAIFGIRFGEVKILGYGLVLLFGAAVFALLFVGTREIVPKGEQNEA